MPLRTMKHRASVTSFRRAGLVTVLIQGAALVSNVIFLVVLTRALGPSEFGRYMLFLVAGQLGGAVASMGTAAITPYLIGELGTSHRSLSSNVWRIASTVGIVLWGGATLANYLGWQTEALAHPAMLALYAVAASVLSYYNRFALCVDRVVLSSALIALPPFFNLLSALLLALLNKMTADLLFTTSTIGIVGTLVWGHVLLNERLVNSDGGAIDISSHLRVGGLGFASALFGLMALRVDFFIVRSLAGLRELGLYAFGIQLAEMAVRVPGFLSGLLGPRAANNPAGTAVLTVKLAVLNLAFALLVYLPLIIAPALLFELLGRIFGRAMVEESSIIIYLAPRVLCLAMNSAFAGYLVGRGFTVFHPAASVGALALTALADVILIPRFGGVGASVASSLGQTLATVVFVYGFTRSSGMSLREMIDVIRPRFGSPVSDAMPRKNQEGEP